MPGLVTFTPTRVFDLSGKLHDFDCRAKKDLRGLEAVLKAEAERLLRQLLPQ